MTSKTRKDNLSKYTQDMVNTVNKQKNEFNALLKIPLTRKQQKEVIERINAHLTNFSFIYRKEYTQILQEAIFKGDP